MMESTGEENAQRVDSAQGEASAQEANGAPASAGTGAAGLLTGSDLCPKTKTETGLPYLTTWNTAYIFVACTFCLWLALLIALTELSA